MIAEVIVCLAASINSKQTLIRMQVKRVLSPVSLPCLLPFVLARAWLRAILAKSEGRFLPSILNIRMVAALSVSLHMVVVSWISQVKVVVVISLASSACVVDRWPLVLDVALRVLLSVILVMRRVPG